MKSQIHHKATHQHCPMADNDKGADWLSSEKEIMNPYFGESMLRCGEVTKTFE
jgi:membrane fusion protein, copper/silver efflux system